MSNIFVIDSELRCKLDILKEQRIKAEKAFEEFKHRLDNGPTKWEKHYVEHIDIILNPDFRRAVDIIKRRYSYVG